MRRLRKHRVIVILTVEEPVTRDEAASYIAEAVETWHGQRIPRYHEMNAGFENDDSILCGEVKEVKIR